MMHHGLLAKDTVHVSKYQVNTPPHLWVIQEGA